MKTILFAILCYLDDGNMIMKVEKMQSEKECQYFKADAEKNFNVSAFEKVDFICTDEDGLVGELGK